jgi:hypothetical protein
MNVLILTPERTGSTLLQRVLTTYMQQKKYSKPVVDLQNIGLGISSYYNQSLNQSLLKSGSEVFQSLDEIISLLSSTDQFSVCKLNYRTIKQRQDSIADQLKFYNYLNKNFYIIKSKRENIFEYALSWCIYSHSKTFNVYDNHHKYTTFKNFYQNKISVFQESFIGYLDRYLNYYKWVDENFDVQSHFTYEFSYANLEEYILNLDFMKDSSSKTWKNIYGQTFNDWNLCHYIAGNLEVSKSSKTSRYFGTSKTHIRDWENLKGANWPNLTNNIHSDVELLSENIKNEICQLVDLSLFSKELSVSPELSKFLDQHLSAYTESTLSIRNLVEDGILHSEFPIKLHTINDKEKIIANFNQCIEWYNEWATQHGFTTITNAAQSQNNIELLGYNPYSI